MTPDSGLAPNAISKHVQAWAQGHIQQAKQLAVEHSPRTTVGLLAWATFGCCAITAGAAILSTSAFVLSGILTGLLLALSAGSVMLGFVLGGVACFAGCLAAMAASMLTSAWVMNMCIKAWLRCLSYLSPDMHAWLVQRFESWHLPGLIQSFMHEHVLHQLPGSSPDVAQAAGPTTSTSAVGAHRQPQRHPREPEWQNPQPKPLRMNTRPRALSRSCNSLNSAGIDGEQQHAAESDVPDAACFDELDQEMCAHPADLFHTDAFGEEEPQQVGGVDHIPSQPRMLLPAVSAAPTQQLMKKTLLDDAVSATMLEPAAA